MERFAVWADWVLGEPVTDELLVRVHGSWPQADDSLCSSVNPDDPEVLTLSFEVDAADFYAAVSSARAVVVALAERLELPGHLLPLTAYTETHQFTER